MGCIREAVETGGSLNTEKLPVCQRHICKGTLHLKGRLPLGNQEKGDYNQKRISEEGSALQTDRAPFTVSFLITPIYAPHPQHFAFVFSWRW